ncbi:oxygenase MpaB family protein [Actinokineospora sp. G85]|uniref:oxygenase MpaB family protein n=1 Tax=Actinokineospora sp. G85 TaxID=3406626 RepID=UPI003C730BE1
MSRPPVLDVDDLGLVGPDSVTWQAHADPAMWLGGVRSLYLQALHPRAVAGVVQNSDFQADPLGRLFRTADFVGVTTYGTTTEAEAAAAGVRRVHRALRATDPDAGETFRIDDPELLLWVHCAEVASFLTALGRGGYPMTEAHANRYLAEQRTSAALVGLDPEEVPGSIAEMTAYFRRLRPLLRRTEASDVIYDFLHRPPLSGWLAVGARVYEPTISHVAYSLLPSWAKALHGRRGYPAPVATGAARALRLGALAVLPRVRERTTAQPAWVAAVRRLGDWATPSPDRLPGRA